MLIHYLNNFLRHCSNNKTSTFIHVLGLSLGMTICALLSLFVWREFSYDQHWQHKDRMFRVNCDFIVPNRDIYKSAKAMGPLKDTLLREIPQIESAARIFDFSGVFTVESQGESRLVKDETVFVDPEFFDIFEVEVIDGDLSRVGQDPGALAITPAFAHRQFGTQNALGRTLKLSLFNETLSYEVAAVVEPAPILSDLRWESLALLHPPHFEDMGSILERWYSTNTPTYIKLRRNTDLEALNASLPEFIDRSFPTLDVGAADQPVSESVKLTLQPIQDAHLDPDYNSHMKPLGNRNSCFLYLAVAFLVLSIACINFVNMSVARAMHRAREISIRKVLGASRKSIVVQVSFESILLALASHCVALVWLELCADPFFVAIERPETVQDLPLLPWMLASITMTALLGLVSGLYPALVISKFKPAWVLKSNQSTSSKGASLARSALIVTQFVISSAIIVATGVLWAQNELASDIELGFDHAALFSVSEVQGTKDDRRAQSFKERVKEIEGVRSVALAEFSPGGHRGNNTLVRRQDQEASENALLGALRVGGDFFDCLSVPMLAGHDLSDKHGIPAEPSWQTLTENPDVTLNSHGVINRAALKLFGFSSPQDAIGKRLLMDVDYDEDTKLANLSYEIVGVVDDLRFGSLHHSIRPVLYTKAGENAHDYALVQFDPKALPNALPELRQVTKEWFPSPLTTVEATDQAFYRAYERERRNSALMAGAGIAALGIAMLGLFGLSMFVVKQQRKEIGIRKTFGASTLSILGLMFMRFCRPLLAASIVGCVLGLYLVDKQLQDYTEHVSILGTGIWIALATIAVHLAVAALAVGPHTLRIANMHPREALRHE